MHHAPAFSLAAAAALALPVAGCVDEAGPPVIVEPWTETTDAVRGHSALRSAMMGAHNDARRAVGVGPLAWDAALARDAGTYAAYLARTGKFEHAPHNRTNPQGENLWMGTRSAYSYTDMIGHWVDERRYYKPGNSPKNSTTGRIGDVGHYTQIIWRGTTRVGCALASNDRIDVLVCRYSPPGNVMGRSPLG